MKSPDTLFVSVEECNQALQLNGISFLGTQLKIGRPKNFEGGAPAAAMPMAMASMSGVPGMGMAAMTVGAAISWNFVVGALRSCVC